jgi:hypothetical protein
MNVLDTMILKTWRTYRALHLHRVSSRVLRGAPSVVHRRVAGLKHHLSLLSRRRFTPASELRHFYRRALVELRARSAGSPLGDYFEFGVFNGTSLIAMYRALRDLELDEIRLFGFDSFEGLPPDEEGHWGPGGRFSCDIDTTREILEREHVDLNRVTLIKGFFNETLTDRLRARHGMRRASVVMVDCDLYRSAVECLTFSIPLIQGDALLVFDDWHPLAAQNMGEKRAFDEVLAANPDLAAVPFGTYGGHAEAFIVTRTASRPPTLEAAVRRPEAP